MKKRALITLGVVLALAATASLLMALPAGAASWAEKVTGGGQGMAGGVHFSITVSAWDGPAGQMEYSREGQSLPDLSMHGTVECLGLFSDNTVAVAAGPASVQYDPAGLIGPGDWMVVEISEGGVGYGDRVRVRLMSENAALATCNQPSGLFPGLIYDGNFNIRTK
jgi:hypothetical protein